MREGWWWAGAVASLGPVSSSMTDCLQTEQEGVCSLSEPFCLLFWTFWVSCNPETLDPFCFTE